MEEDDEGTCGLTPESCASYESEHAVKVESGNGRDHSDEHCEDDHSHHEDEHSHQESTHSHHHHHHGHSHHAKASSERYLQTLHLILELQMSSSTRTWQSPSPQ